MGVGGVEKNCLANKIGRKFFNDGVGMVLILKKNNQFSVWWGGVGSGGKGFLAMVNERNTYTLTDVQESKT